ncbi:MAG: tRNA (guanine-N1)-methyltransferase, partial [Gammaproteobacteria bacterium]|nr:tRNA (guanine-N1)-methyltransferase [Gammaproteobacteria bacterium]
MQFGIISLFPDMFQTLHYGIVGRAIRNQLIAIQTWNPRDYAPDKHRTVDDRPYGGGPGMVMMVQPLQEAVHTAKLHLGQDSKVIYLSPQGQPFNQAAAKQMATQDKIIFVAGRYEGVDERFIKTVIDEEWSIGDYVLSGGELATMVMIDAIVRLLPGALGHNESAEQDSFNNGLLDCPHYTRPEVINGLSVPEVLLSGNHQAINKWRLKQALYKTQLYR